MRITTNDDDRLVFRVGTTDVAEYVWRPDELASESPRPYFNLRTARGERVTGYRPLDHVWHRGLSLALPNVSEHNFWGGSTYVTDQGYVQLPNNGSQQRISLDVTGGGDEPILLSERLHWRSAAGGLVIDESREITLRTIDDATWALTWTSALQNVTQAPLDFGSPTSHGRPDAGYAGIFWRGPESFVGGRILGAAGEAGEAARGADAAWLAFSREEENVGVLMLDGSGTPGPWFARSEEYAGMCPAPFFHRNVPLAPGDRMSLSAIVLIGDAEVARFAGTVGTELVAELTAAAPAPSNI